MIDCTDYDFLRIVSALRTLITIVKIVVPLIIIVMGMLDFFKIVTEGTPEATKKAAQTLLIRIVAGIMIFFLPSIIDTFMGFVNGYSDAQNTYSTCIENSKNLNYYKDLKEEKIAIKKKERQEARAAAEKQRKEQENAAIAAMKTKETYNSNTTTDGTFILTKHEISDADIAYIASVSLCEQGKEEGVAAEASQIVNRYELYGKSSETIKQYIIRSKWWQCANDGSKRKATEESKSAVKNVIALGNRVLPPYVDEQDCPSCKCSNYCSNGLCVCSVTTNGTTHTAPSEIKSHDTYVQDKSRVVNDWKENYTYYTHACSGDCDIFGYTDSALERYKKLNGS